MCADFDKTVMERLQGGCEKACPRNCSAENLQNCRCVITQIVTLPFFLQWGTAAAEMKILFAVTELSQILLLYYY